MSHTLEHRQGSSPPTEHASVAVCSVRRLIWTSLDDPREELGSVLGVSRISLFFNCPSSLFNRLFGVRLICVHAIEKGNELLDRAGFLDYV